jgi:C_GCAxxG_C_C family probable redox protein
MDRVELAVSLFKQGFSCSQAVLAAYSECLGLDRELALRVAAGFGGGMGRMAQTCGAVTGAYMLIGMKYGVVDAKARQAKEKTYALVREFAGRFRGRHGSLVCRELLGCDLSTPEGFQLAKERKLSDTVCANLVRDAATMIAEIV